MRLRALVVIMFFFLVTGSFVIIFIDERCEASGNEIYVDDDYYLPGDGSAEHPYRSIQYAINLADEGDTIYVFGGDYNETLMINKRLNIIGSIDDGNTIINYRQGHNKYTVEITADKVILEGFNITDSGNYIISDIKGALVHVTSDDVIIQRNNITRCQNAWGIYLDSSDGNVIGDNFINDTRVGVYLSSSNTNDIINNIISSCTNAGAKMDSSENNRLYNNEIDNNNYGLYIRDCSNINISNNTISSSQFHGVCIYQDVDDVIVNNIIRDNSGDGIHLNSLNSKIRGNSFESNQIGINLDSSFCKIIGNIINDSFSSGIYAGSGSENNIVYLNFFHGNDVNANEKGDNQWYYENQGNYWDDYNEVDRDGDGIGDTPYTIVGGVQDKYPLGIFLKPPFKPTDPSPEDGEDNVGLKITLNVSVYDPDGEMMDVYFYNASGALLGVDKNVFSGKWATCNFYQPFATTFAWYAVANDSRLENQSIYWFFTTRQRPPENEKPVADPGGPYTAGIDQVIVFDASGSSDPDGEIDFYRWNFGDGTSEILDISPTHSYSTPDTYYVTLTVIDNDGTSAMATATVTITSSSTNQQPVALTGGPYSGYVGGTISLNGSYSYDPDAGGAITNYTWDFEDGVKEYEANPTHIYTVAGKYNVTLTVTDNEGSKDTATTTITIYSSYEETPGFEIIFSLIAIAFILIWKRRRN